MNEFKQVHVDKQQVCRAFDRAAASYDEAAVLQREIGRRMLDRLASIKAVPEKILDVGAGTGSLSLALKKHYAENGARVSVTAVDLSRQMLTLARGRSGWFRPMDVVCADAESLPFKANSFDMVFSNLCLQWVNDLPACLGRIFQVLKPGGVLLFSTFGPQTLHELRHSWRGVDSEVHVHDFVDMHHIGDIMLSLGFVDPVVHSECLTLTYSRLKYLLRDLKAIGAGNASVSRRRSLSGKTRFARVEENYENFRRDGVLPATYEVVYGMAWGGGDNKPAAAVVPFHRPQEGGRT